MKTSFFNFNRKVFSTTMSSLFKYSDPANPKVFLKIAKNNTELGRLVFELYSNKCPESVNMFRNFCKGTDLENFSYKNTVLSQIFKGFALRGGRIMSEFNEDISSDIKMEEENLNLKHTKRGVLTLDNDGPGTTSSKFMVTFDETPWLDGYHVVIGELVEGDNILSEIESCGTREGTPKAQFKILDCGDLV